MIKLVIGWTLVLFTIGGMGTDLETLAVKGDVPKDFDISIYLSFIFLFLGAFLIYSNTYKVDRFDSSALSRICQKSNLYWAVGLIVFCLVAAVGLIEDYPDNMTKDDGTVGAIVLVLLVWFIGWRLFFRHRLARYLLDVNTARVSSSLSSASSGQVGAISETTVRSNIGYDLEPDNGIGQKQKYEFSNYWKLVLSLFVSLTVTGCSKFLLAIESPLYLVVIFVISLIFLTFQLIPVSEFKLNVKKGLISVKRHNEDK